MFVKGLSIAIVRPNEELALYYQQFYLGQSRLYFLF